MEDFKLLVKLYFELKRIAARLIEIEQRHPGARHFKKVVDKAILEIDSGAHLIFKEARELKQIMGSSVEK